MTWKEHAPERRFFWIMLVILIIGIFFYGQPGGLLRQVVFQIPYGKSCYMTGNNICESAVSYPNHWDLFPHQSGLSTNYYTDIDYKQWVCTVNLRINPTIEGYQCSASGTINLKDTQYGPVCPAKDIDWASKVVCPVCSGRQCNTGYVLGLVYGGWVEFKKQECQEGEIRCVGNDIEKCVGNGGPKWMYVETCEEPSICSEGECVTPCPQSLQFNINRPYEIKDSCVYQTCEEDTDKWYSYCKGRPVNDLIISDSDLKVLFPSECISDEECIEEHQNCDAYCKDGKCMIPSIIHSSKFCEDGTRIEWLGYPECRYEDCPTCEEGKIRCGLNKVEICSDEAWLTYETCNYGCTEINGTPTCMECISGTSGTIECWDESTITTKICVEGFWQETGNECPEKPKGISPGWIVIIGIILIGIYGIYKWRR
jgi:hypothetical protein